MVGRLANIVRRTLDQRYRSEVIRKARYHFHERANANDRAESEAWCRTHAEDPTAWAQSLDAAAWDEAKAFASAHFERALQILKDAPPVLGGGGSPALLYFLTRTRRPRHVVETGVAAGHTSRAILSAIAANRHGHLWSSDLPYFTVEQGEALIGLIVEDELRRNWTLKTEGDRRCLPLIANDAAPIDLFHYDSDKSREGREFAWSLVAPRLAPGALVLFDDIQDNTHFRELTATAKAFHVFAFRRNWVGLIDTGEAGALGANLPFEART
jgi:predicted O-methyltransferase YrrM